MRKKIKILQREKGDRESRWQTFLYESEKENTTVAQALSELNQRSSPGYRRKRRLLF